jgi:hypothetical protein
MLQRLRGAAIAAVDALCWLLSAILIVGDLD